MTLDAYGWGLEYRKALVEHRLACNAEKAVMCALNPLNANPQGGPYQNFDVLAVDSDLTDEECRTRRAARLRVEQTSERVTMLERDFVNAVNYCVDYELPLSQYAIDRHKHLAEMQVAEVGLAFMQKKAKRYRYDQPTRADL